jgi:hypothetical protein
VARSNHIHNSFVAGELSPKFYGRVDTPQYNQGLATAKNALVYPQGGATKRPGTAFRHDVLSFNLGTGFDEPGAHPEGARIFPFYASDGTSWVLVLTTDPPNFDPNRPAGPPADDRLLHWRAYQVGRGEIQYHLRPKNHIMFNERVGVDTSVNGYIMFDDTYYTFTQKELDELQFAQAGDVMYFTHPRYRPFRIFKTSTNTFRMDVVGYTKPLTTPLSIATDANSWRSVPYEPRVGNLSSTNFSGIEILGTSPLTIGQSDTTKNLFNGFLSKYVRGDTIKFTKGVNTRVFVVLSSSGSAGSTELVGTWRDTPGTFSAGDIFGLSGDPDNTYEVPTWYGRTWPRSVEFFESRLIFGGTANDSDRIWFSRLNNIIWIDQEGLAQDPDFTDPVAANDSFFINLRSNTINEVRWISGGKSLLVGTNEAEFVLEGPNQQAAISQLNISNRAESFYGSLTTQPVRFENTVVFAQSDGKRLRELVFDFNEDSYRAADLNIIADHILNRSRYDLEEEGVDPDDINYLSNIKNIYLQKTPFTIIWALDDNGYLYSLTRERDQDVAAYSWHKIAGNGKVISFCTATPPRTTYREITGTNVPLAFPPSNDSVFVLVKRDIDGVDKFYLEQLTDIWEERSIEKGWSLNLLGSQSLPFRVPIYLDCAYLVSTSDSLDPSVNGLIERLPFSEGDTVRVLCNGFDFGDYVVNEDHEIDISNNLSSPTEPFNAIVGYSYSMDIVPITPEVPAQIGSSQNQPRRIDQLGIHMYRSLGGAFGKAKHQEDENTPFYNLETIIYPVGNTNTPPQLFTGIKNLNFPMGYDRRPEVLIRSDRPFPFIITHVVYRMVVYE